MTTTIYSSSTGSINYYGSTTGTTGTIPSFNWVIPPTFSDTLSYGYPTPQRYDITCEFCHKYCNQHCKSRK